MTSSILGGMPYGDLPYDLLSINTIRLFLYILILTLGNCASGIPASRLIVKPQGSVLIRAGWRLWFWGILCRCFLAVLAVSGGLLLIGLLSCPEWRTLWAWLLFTFHMEMISAVQALLTALFENAMVSVSSVTLTQIISLFMSSQLPGAWPIIFPGNWGALARTAEFEVPDNYGRLHGGFPLWAAVVLNAAVLLAICLFGWRIVRRKRMKQ